MSKLAEKILPMIEDKIEKEICGRLADISSTLNLVLFTRSLEAITNFDNSYLKEINSDGELIETLGQTSKEIDNLIQIIGTDEYN